MVTRTRKRIRVLDFDIENRPLSYLGSDFTTSDITAIAAGWIGSKEISCWLLGSPENGGMKTEEMLAGFLEMYDEADIVTGHYIRAHDLPIINGALLEFGLSPLSGKLTSDTKLDLVKRKGISASQENLSLMYGLPQPKAHMSQVEWREANRLTKRGIALTRKRVIYDVKQHKALRLRLIRADALGPAKWWKP